MVKVDFFFGGRSEYIIYKLAGGDGGAEGRILNWEELVGSREQRGGGYHRRLELHHLYLCSILLVTIYHQISLKMVNPRKKIF